MTTPSVSTGAPPDSAQHAVAAESLDLFAADGSSDIFSVAVDPEPFADDD